MEHMEVTAHLVEERYQASVAQHHSFDLLEDYY
jgi:hypothetical protein